MLVAILVAVYLLGTLISTKVIYEVRGYSASCEKGWTEAAASSLFWPLRICFYVPIVAICSVFVGISWIIGRTASLAFGSGA